jgi:hypothetical protein
VELAPQTIDERKMFVSSVVNTSTGQLKKLNDELFQEQYQFLILFHQ